MLGGTRIIGLGGAYGGVAEGAIGIGYTPAAVANRARHSKSKLDGDLGFDFLTPGIFQGDSFDFNNTGRGSGDFSFAVVVALMLQYGRFGVGYHLRGQGLALAASELKVRLWIHQLSAGWAFLEHQLLVGIGVRMGSLTIARSIVPLADDISVLRAFSGEVGLLVRPNGFPWELRFAAAIRFGHDALARAPRYLSASKGQGVGPTSAPTSRPTPRPRVWGGRYLMVSAEAVFIGAVPYALSADGFAAQLEEKSGVKPTLSLRLGAEAEVWPRRVRLRCRLAWPSTSPSATRISPRPSDCGIEAPTYCCSALCRVLTVGALQRRRRSRLMMSAKAVTCACVVAFALVVSACSDKLPPVDASTGSDSTSSDTTTAKEGGGADTQIDIATQVQNLLDQLGALAALAGAQGLADQLCSLIDNNPNYTSNTIFSTVGKKPFAEAIRAAYNKSSFLRDFVKASGYWAAASETVDPDTVITQTGNSCETNVGFINAVCFASGVQYTANGSYKASEAPNSGGCSEARK